MGSLKHLGSACGLKLGNEFYTDMVGVLYNVK